MCDVCYLCANFSLPRPLCSRLRPDVRDKQTDVRQTDVRRASSLNAPYPRGAGIMMNHRPRKIGRAHSCGGWSVIRVHSISVSRIRNAILVRIAVNVNIFRVT